LFLKDEEKNHHTFKLLKKKRNQFVPRCKHFPPRL